jgi:excisionase family DNA binding protein
MRIDLNKLVSQKEAAEIRGCTTQAISGLIQRGSLKTVTVGGKRLLFRDEVEKFVPSVGGRPKGKPIKNRPRKSK